MKPAWISVFSSENKLHSFIAHLFIDINLELRNRGTLQPGSVSFSFLDLGGLLPLSILQSSVCFLSCAGDREKWLGAMDKGLSF